MKTVSINEEVTVQWVESVRTYEATSHKLRLCGIKFSSEDATKESIGNDYPISSERPEIVFRVPSIKMKDVAFLQKLILSVS